MYPALSQSRWLRFLTFGALYFAQGVPWGFISVGYVVFLTDIGLDNTAIGDALALAYIPWSFKLVWGPLIDALPPRFALRVGRRRPFIAFAELMMGLTLISLAFVDARSQLQLVAVILFVHNTFASMQDVAVDALAVDLLAEDERGRANSIMWAAKSVGVAVGGGGGTLIAKWAGWTTLFIVLSCIIWAIMLFPVLLRERPAGVTATPAPTPPLKPDGEQTAAEAETAASPRSSTSRSSSARSRSPRRGRAWRSRCSPRSGTRS